MLRRDPWDVRIAHRIRRFAESAARGAKAYGLARGYGASRRTAWRTMRGFLVIGLFGCAGLAPRPEHPDASACRQIAWAACENAVNHSCEGRMWRTCMGALGWRVIDGHWVNPGRCEVK